MHAPRPYGLHVIGGNLTPRDEGFIQNKAAQVANIKQLSGLDSERLVYDLPDGGYAIIQDMGGNFRVVAHKPLEKETFKPTGFATDFIPMLFSGRVISPTPFTTNGTTLKITKTCQRRLTSYQANIEPPPNEITLKRFLVEYHPKFRYFEPFMKGNRTFTQYHKLLPTWYSGAISEVVQVIGGYGKQNLSELPDNSVERAQFLLPSDVLAGVRIELAGKRLPAYHGLPDNEGQIKYDYTHGNCNGVAFDSSNKPWLLRVSYSGVHAMPLPMIPATTTQAFRRYIESVQDDEILHLLDRFGGMPSGESFPQGAAFQAWLRAGVIIKVCDAKEFYKHSAFYGACGWSFNSQGTEAFNTGWSFNAQGLRHAYGFKLRLRLAAASQQGLIEGVRNLVGADREAVNRYLGWLFQQTTEDTERDLAVRYKISRTSDKDLLTLAKTSKPDILYWDNLIHEPIANHQGSINQVSQGAMCWRNPSPKSFGALKFPEFTGQGCESFDMTMPDYKGGFVRSDTVVFGCYVNDQLQVIKFFLDERKFNKQTESNFEDVMIVGDWEKTETTGSTGLLGYLYTTDFDDRREASESTTYTKVTGRDLGYGNPAFHTPSLLYMWGGLSRSRYYSFRTEVTSISSDSLSVATCVPALARDCILYANTESYQSKSYSDKMEKRSVGDPTSYSIWTYDPIFHYLGDWQRARGEPRPTIGQFVYVVYDPKTDYQPNKYSWFADSGNWYNVPPNSFLDVSGICAPYTTRGNTHHANGVVIGGEAPKLDTYQTSKYDGAKQSGYAAVSIQVRGSVVLNKKIPDRFYYDFSPVDVAGAPYYFYRDANWITCGNSRYSSTSEVNHKGERSYFGYSSIANLSVLNYFIGVINE